MAWDCRSHSVLNYNVDWVLSPNSISLNGLTIRRHILWLSEACFSHTGLSDSGTVNGNANLWRVNLHSIPRLLNLWVEVLVVLPLASIVIFEHEKLHFPAVWTCFLTGYDPLLYYPLSSSWSLPQHWQILRQVAEIVRVQGEKAFIDTITQEPWRNKIFNSKQHQKSERWRILEKFKTGSCRLKNILIWDNFTKPLMSLLHNPIFRHQLDWSDAWHFWFRDEISLTILWCARPRYPNATTHTYATTYNFPW